MAARKLHWWRHAGHTPPLSNVFHSLPHAQDHRSFLRGDQPQSGHRMRGPDGSRFFSRSGSRSKTTDESSERGPHTSRYDELVRHANASRFWQNLIVRAPFDLLAGLGFDSVSEILSFFSSHHRDVASLQQGDGCLHNG